MPLVPAKCPECGGLVEVDSEKRAGLCQHCGQPFVVEDAIQTFNTYYQTTNNYNTTHNYGDGAVVNVYEDKQKDFEIIGGVLKKYKGESTEVVIPENVTKIGERAFEGTAITKIVIPSSIKVIGEDAFDKCELLKEVEFLGDFVEWNEINFVPSWLIGLRKDIRRYPNPNITAKNLIIDGKRVEGVYRVPDGVTRINTVVFYGCKNLTEIILPNSIERIADEAFKNCWNLEKINLPCGLKWIGEGAFTGCQALKNIEIPNSVLSVYNNSFDKYIKKIKIPCNLLKKFIYTDESGSHYTGTYQRKTVSTIHPKHIIVTQNYDCESIIDYFNADLIEFDDGKSIRTIQDKTKKMIVYNKISTADLCIDKMDALGYGATIEEATINAKKFLNAPAGVRVSLEIMQMPSKKLFSKKDAIVKAFIDN